MIRIAHDTISKTIEEVLPTVTQLRHSLHAHPEIAGDEHTTRECLLGLLKGTGAIIWQPKLRTDLILEIPGRDPGRVIGLRADMDGLPLTEETGREYSSCVPGMMHACGHDGHMAILTGVALVLSRLQSYLPCTVRFIFQPGEEEACLGKELVDKGVCDGLEAVYGFHNWPGLPLGAISCKTGIFFAAANTFKARFIGKGAHGATPSEAINPLICAAQSAVRLQGLHDSFGDDSKAVVSVCRIEGGRNTNIIPSEALLAGTTRYTELSIGDRIELECRRILEEEAEARSATLELDYERKYYLPVINDAEAVMRLKRAVASTLGEGAWIEAESHTMTAEDFAFYLEKTPGCMFCLGVGEEASRLHSPTYDFDDDALYNGILVLSSVVFGEGLT